MRALTKVLKAAAWWSLPAVAVLALGLMTSACVDDTADLLGPDPIATLKYGVPGGGGGGGNGGGGGQGGGGKKGDVYAELVYLYRAVDGRPIMKEFGTEACLQPIAYQAFEGGTEVTNPVDGRQVWLIPLVGDQVTLAAEEEEEEAPCDVDPAYLDYVREVEMSRLSMARSPKVYDRALNEVLNKLRFASELLLDPAGRLVVDGVTIDAPAENYAIHISLQKYGDIRGPLGTFDPPVQPGAQHAFLDHAASGIAGAADKYLGLNLDIVIYSNRVLDIPESTTVMETLESERVNGELLGVPGELYLDYGDYTYSRSETFPGCVQGYELVDGVPVLFEASLMEAVFGDEDFTGSNVYGFAQRADDARAVIAYTHDLLTVTAVDRIGESVVCTPEE